MAIFQDGLVPGNMQVSLGGQIVNTGTGAGAVDFVVGVGFTAVRTTQGVYVITLDQQYQPLWACTATIQSTTNDDYHCVVTNVTDVVPGTNNTIEITVFDGAPGAQDLLNERIHFQLTLVVSAAQ
jgi:hypothetical protein